MSNEKMMRFPNMFHKFEQMSYMFYYTTPRNLPSFGSHRGPKSVATPQILDACDNPQTLRYSQRSLGPDCA